MIALTVFALLTFNWDLMLVSGTAKTPTEFVQYINDLDSTAGVCVDEEFNVNTCKTTGTLNPGDKWTAMCDACAETTCDGDYKTASRKDFTDCCTACDSGVSDNLATDQQCCVNCPTTIVDKKISVVDFVSYIDVNLIKQECKASNLDTTTCSNVHANNDDWGNMCGTLDKTSCTEEENKVTPDQLKSCCTECETEHADDSATQTTCCVACPDSILTPDTTSEPEDSSSQTENPAPEPEKTTTQADNDKNKTTANPSSSVDETTEGNGTDVTDTSATLAPLTAKWIIAIAIGALTEHFFLPQ